MSKQLGNELHEQYRRKVFLLLVSAVTLAFLWVAAPFFGAILWGTVIAVMFVPLYRRILKVMRGRRNSAATTTIFIVILPMALIVTALIQEITNLYERIQSGELNFVSAFQTILGAMPGWISEWLDKLGLTTVDGIQQKVSIAPTNGRQFLAEKTLNIGQSTLSGAGSGVV